MGIDFEENAVELDDDSIKRIAALAIEQVRLEDLLKEREAENARIMAELRHIAVDLLPSLLEEVGIEHFKLTTGETIFINKKITASPPADKRDAAYAWLRQNGHDSLIKNEVIASFGKGEDAKAEAMLTALSKKGFVVKRKESVHFQTLSAFVREQLEQGKDIPAETLGVYEVKQSVVKR